MKRMYLSAGMALTACGLIGDSWTSIILAGVLIIAALAVQLTGKKNRSRW